jgi:EF hand
MCLLVKVKLFAPEALAHVLLSVTVPMFGIQFQEGESMKKQLTMIVLGLAASTAFAANDKAGFDAADSNKDGAITRVEAASFAALEQSFDSADANSNGLIELDEYKQIKVTEETVKQ